MVDERDSLAAALAGRYTVGRLLGEGAMGRVYLGEDLKHHRPLALKVLRPEVAGATGKARFEREISAIATLRHPHILPLIDSGEVDGLLYFITPYIEGETLAEQLRRDGRMPIEEVVAVTRDVAEGLAHAHRLGLLHRDIKPSNILLSEGHALIADFGLSRLVAEPADERISSGGVVVGTPAYMSPEQVHGEHALDGRADVYALGCVVFEMLVGRPPFSGRGMAATLAGHLTEPVPDLTELRPELPEGVVAAVGRALSKSPVERWQDAGEFADALAEGAAGSTFAGGGYAAGPYAARSARSRWLVMGGGTLALAAALSVGLIYGLSDSRGSGVDDAEEPRDFVVVGYRPPGAGSEERAELTRTEEELVRQLAGWDGVHVIPPSSRAALERELELATGDPLAAGEALAIARRAGVGTLVAFERTVRGDSVDVVAQRYDAASGEARGPPMTAAALAADLTTLVAPVAAGVLDFDGPPGELATLKGETRSLRAVRLLRAGRSDLEQRRLPSAERLLRETVAADSAFGRAHHLLSVTLYWRGSDQPSQFADIGGEMRRHATTARRLSQAMPERDRTAVEAWFQFQNGDYQAARQGYEALVASDPTDVWAWLDLGVVEYRDRWAVEGPDGEPRPRHSFNRATEAFLRAVGEDPDFYLGFGHLFTVHRHLAAAAASLACYPFWLPGQATMLFWEDESGESVVKCPVVRDTVEYVDRTALREMPQEQLLAGAERYLERSMVQLRRWAEYAPDSPWPSKALADWALQRAELRVAGGTTVPWADLVADGADHAERVLALSADTMPEDLVRAASFRLAAGDLSSAAAAVDRAMALAGDRTFVVPPEAANALMAGGRVEAALRLDRGGGSRMTIGDGQGGRVEVLVLPTIGRIRVMAATGLVGPPLQAAFGEMEATWSAAGYSEAQRVALRRFLSMTVIAALSLDRDARRGWFEGWEPTDPQVRGLALADTDPGEARRHLDDSMRALEDGASNRRVPFAAGVTAQLLGDHAAAVRAFTILLDTRALLNRFDDGWGLGTLSHLLRARSREALGDVEGALADYGRFADAWRDADPEVAGLREEARAAMARLGG